jgi:ubiquinone/menaquinone biosynthesis C-methylase UbiE
MQMQKHMGNLWFRLMTLEYRLKSDSVLALGTLKDAGIQPGMSILDFGCGPGRYALPAAEMVGSHGMVYAVDVHPLAIRMVENTAEKVGVTNLQAIHADCSTGLPSGSVDIVLLYDTLHDVENKKAVLQELRRVLKLQGTLSYKDHTLWGESLLSLFRSNGFSLSSETKTQLIFKKLRRMQGRYRPRVSETDHGIVGELNVSLYDQMQRNLRDRNWIEKKAIGTALTGVE